MPAQFIAHPGAVTVARGALQDMATPGATGRWQPVPHSALVDSLSAAMARRGMVIKREAYAIHQQGHVLCDTMDLDWQAHKGRCRPLPKTGKL